MSTKTTFKRVALVVVAALGFGVLTSIAPASAVNGATASSIVVGDIPAVRTGATAYVPVKLYLSSSAVAADTMSILAKLTSAPIMGGAANATSNLNAGQTAASNNADEQ